MDRKTELFSPAAPLGRLFLFLLLTCFCFGISGQAAAAARKKKTAAPVKTHRKSTKADKPFTNETQTERPNSYYENAWREFEVGSDKEKKQVISALNKLVKKDPSDSMAHYYLGIMLSQTESFKQSEEHFRAALQAYPESDDVMFRLAEVLMERKQIDEAFQLYEKVHQINPKQPGALSKLGFKALTEQKYDLAIELLTQARAGAPEERDTLRQLGIAFLASNRHADAVEPLQACLKLDDSDADAHLILGKAYQALNKPAEAAAEMEKAKNLGRKDADLKALIGYDLANNFFDAGKTDDAIAELQKSIKTSADPASGWFQLGKIYEDRGERDKAIKAYEKAFELDPKMGEAMFQIGKIHRAEEELEKALDAFQTIAKQKDWADQAKIEIDEINEAIREKKRDELLDIAASGDEDQKQKSYLAMLEIDKKDQEALEGLRDLAQTRGDLSQVDFYIKELRKAGHLTKEQAEIQRNELSYRVDAGEDLAAWENRLEDFKKNGEWDKAIKENQKLKDYALAQLDYWKKHTRDMDLRKEMIKATKARLQTIGETMKDLHAAKKRHK